MGFDWENVVNDKLSLGVKTAPFVFTLAMNFEKSYTIYRKSF